MKYWLLIFLFTFNSNLVHAQEGCKIELADNANTFHVPLRVAGVRNTNNKLVTRSELEASPGLLPDCRFEYNGKQVRLFVTRFIVEIVRNNKVVSRISNGRTFSKRYYYEMRDLMDNDIIKFKEIEVSFSDSIDLSGKTFTADSLQYRLTVSGVVFDKRTRVAMDAIHGFEQLKRLVAHYCSIAYMDEPCSYMPGVPKYGADNNLVLTRYEFFQLNDEIDYIWTFIYNRTTKQYSVHDGLKDVTYTLAQWNAMMAKVDMINK